MIRKSITLIAALILSALTLSAREVTNINRGWQFAYGEQPGAEQPGFDSSTWTVVNLPHDYQISQPWVPPGEDEKADLDNAVANIKSRLSARGFKEMGQGWYRRTLDVKPEWRDKRVLLDFGGIMLVGDVWFNGHHVGKTDYGYLGFESDITPYINWEGPNIIAVRADTGTPDNSRWYTGGGLYRDVNVVVTDRDRYFARHPLYITTPIVSPETASVKIQAEITDQGRNTKTLPVQLRILAPDGTTVYEKSSELKYSRKMRNREYPLDSVVIANPLLWDLDTPYLYTAEVTLFNADGSVADRASHRFGIRSIEYSPDFGLKLNGRKTLLKGIANHHTLGALGAAAYPRAIEKRIKLLKEFGYNHIRCSHNPYSQEFMDLCDENGILVVDELYDKWLTQYAGGRRDWMQLWPENVPEWVKRDRNHPSVVMWSLGNELQLLYDLPFNDWGVTPYRMQKALLDRFDATRPVTVAMHPRGRHQSTDSLPAPLVMHTDVAAYNYRYMYFPGDSRRFPWMMFYQSEANTSGMGPNFFEMNLDKVIGLAYWGSIDYLGESAGWPVKGWAQGVFDISLEPKPLAWFVRSYFKPDEPVVHIGIIDSDDNLVWNDVKVGTSTLSDHWNRTPGSKVNLYTYTNADEVELLVGGKSMGRKANDVTNPQVRNRIFWDSVPYLPGYVEAVAYKDGKAVARHRIETTGAARRLAAEPDNAAWRADGLDLQHVRVQAVDTKGRRDPSARHQVTFSVDGPAEIVAVINGDHTSDELSVGTTRTLWNGTATVILRSLPQAGPVTLTATAPGLKPAKTLLKTI